MPTEEASTATAPTFTDLLGRQVRNVAADKSKNIPAVKARAEISTILEQSTCVVFRRLVYRDDTVVHADDLRIAFEVPDDAPAEENRITKLKRIIGSGDDAVDSKGRRFCSMVVMVELDPKTLKDKEGKVTKVPFSKFYDKVKGFFVPKSYTLPPQVRGEGNSQRYSYHDLRPETVERINRGEMSVEDVREDDRFGNFIGDLYLSRDRLEDFASAIYSTDESAGKPHADPDFLNMMKAGLMTVEAWTTSRRNLVCKMSPHQLKLRKELIADANLNLSRHSKTDCVKSLLNDNNSGIMGVFDVMASLWGLNKAKDAYELYSGCRVSKRSNDESSCTAMRAAMSKLFVRPSNEALRVEKYSWNHRYDVQVNRPEIDLSDPSKVEAWRKSQFVMELDPDSVIEFLTVELDAQEINSVNQAINAWADYLAMQLYLYGDYETFKKRADKYPWVHARGHSGASGGLMIAHDRLARMCGELKDSGLDKQGNWDRVVAYSEPFEESYRDRGDLYELRCPRTRQDLVELSGMLHNCVAGSYLNAVANLTTRIFGLYRTNKRENDGEPMLECCVEINGKGDVCQALQDQVYGVYDPRTQMTIKQTHALLCITEKARLKRGEPIAPLVDRSTYFSLSNGLCAGARAYIPSLRGYSADVEKSDAEGDVNGDTAGAEVTAEVVR